MATFDIPTRDQLIAKKKRDIAYRMGGTIDFGQKDRVDIDASADVDLVLPLFAEAQRFADTTPLSGRTFDQLQDEAASLGLPALIGAAGSSGGVIMQAGPTGAAVTAGDVLIDPLDSSVTWAALETKVYQNGDYVPVATPIGGATGLGTDRDAGYTLQWQSPPPGASLNALVAAASDGSGLTGGREVETRDELLARIEDAHANPAAAGNNAAYVKAITETPGVGVEAAFVIPAGTGPGSVYWMFTVPPSKRGATRVPNNTQIGLVRAQIVGQFDGGDSSAGCALISQATDTVLTVKWAQDVAAWADAVPWPPYSNFDLYKVKNTTTPTATACTVGTTDPGYVAPQVGQTIALFDRANMRFVDKKILTVAVVSPGIWTLTFDTTNGASDTTFTPAVGDYVMPWSDSLPILIDPVAAFYETLGPGEQFATFFDEGYRQRRYPSSPTSWPNEITSRLSTPLEQLSAIDTVLVKSPALPYATPVGVVGVSSNLLEMGKLAVYPG